MDTTKVRMKVGDHEFEAEGTPESVALQLEAFKMLLGAVQSTPKREEIPETPQTQQPLALPSPSSHVPLDRIMHVQGRVVSLTALPAGEGEATLLIMLGNKDFRSNESVTGAEIGDGLAQSGLQVQRVDRVVGKLIDDNLVLKSGFRRGTRYRLSNLGHQKALAIARELIATLP